MKSALRDMAITRAARRMGHFYSTLRKKRFFKILGITCIIILYGALALFISERYYITKGAGGIFDAVYWAVVTIATVGYGDIVPHSTTGKVFALMIILSGPVLLSLVTASIASVFVEKKFRERQGLETIKDKDHIIICGWNRNAEKVIDGIILQAKRSAPKIILVNELNQDEIQSILYRYKDTSIGFVRGNFVKEDVLARANLSMAGAAVVLADISGGHTEEKADERTIFGTMAIKSTASKVRTCAELIHGENREHLMRAHVDTIIVRGESAGPMLATAAVSPGVADSIKLLMGNQDENKLWRISVPPRHIGKPAGELVVFLREKHSALLLALVREREGVKLEDILSEDSTLIDAFIKKKFEESGKNFFGREKDITVTINPPDDYELDRNDWLVVISRTRPS